MDMKEKLSLLWIFAMFNFLYADVLTMYEPGILEELMTGSIDGIQFTQGVLLAAAILMETAIAIVLLSRILEYRVNRWANIIAGMNTYSGCFLINVCWNASSFLYIFWNNRNGYYFNNCLVSMDMA